MHELFLANLKVKQDKTNIFPESCHFYGWVWRKGGILEVSPHKKSSFNSRQDHITKVKHLISFIGLYKTLHMATPATSHILSPLEEAVAGKDSNPFLDWNHSLTQWFREAKSHLKNTQSLYLPHLDDKLVINTDAAQFSPGIGHIVFAIKGKKLLPVWFYSGKPEESWRLWLP